MAKIKNFTICIFCVAFSFCTPRDGNVEQPPVQIQDTIRNTVTIQDTVRTTVQLTDTVRELVKIEESLTDIQQRIYTAEIGVRESGGNNRGKRIKEYLAVTNLGEGYAWCAAFICWVNEEAGIQHPASAWSPTVGLYRTIYRRGGEFPTSPDGLVFSLYYKKLKRIGHVGFIEDIRSEEVVTVEGNTNGDGSRDGDGVHKKVRPKWAVYTISKYDR